MIDETGARYGRLLVLASAGHTSSGELLWQCACDCGGSVAVRGPRLRRGETMSCGCLQRQRTAASNRRRRGKPLVAKQRPSRVDESGATTYRCGRCKLFFTPDEFPKSRRVSLGIGSCCKRCHSIVAIASRDPATTRRNTQRSSANRRAWKAGGGGKVTASDWREVLAILGNECLKCGSDAQPTQDHIIPLARGGAHHPSNLQPLCRPCNERKQARAADYRNPEQRAAIEARWPHATPVGPDLDHCPRHAGVQAGLFTELVR